jgi:hypothetical protein
VLWNVDDIMILYNMNSSNLVHLAIASEPPFTLRLSAVILMKIYPLNVLTGVLVA